MKEPKKMRHRAVVISTGVASKIWNVRTQRVGYKNGHFAIRGERVIFKYYHSCGLCGRQYKPWLLCLLYGT